MPDRFSSREALAWDDDAYTDGMTECLKGIPLSYNPFKVAESLKARSWAAGWADAAMGMLFDNDAKEAQP